MRIGIDARLYGTKNGGIGRYTEELIRNLEQIDQNNEYYIFLAGDNFDDFQPANPKFHKVSADFKVYGVFEQLLYPFLLNKYKLDLVHFPHFNVPLMYSKRFIVTIHDLIISHYPSSRSTTLHPLLYKAKLGAYNLLIEKVAKKAYKILTVSNYTKQDIVKFLKASPEQIIVVYNGVDLPEANAGDNCERILQEFGISGKYLLYVGSAYPHKNLEKLVEAFSEIKKDYPQLQLVLGGKNNFFYERLKQSIETAENLAVIKDSIIFTDYLSDEKLACLYKKAELYVFPSLIEGFGIPPLEAQTYGVPVVSSNATCLPEILADSALYFDPNNTADMGEKISLALASSDVRDELIKKGAQNIKKYSWRKMATEIHDLYLHLH